jgi:multidrug efflux pump subunit AcrA (membrane-fusion protein)
MPPGRDQFATVQVTRADIESSVTALGTLQPRRYVDVGAQASGQIHKIHVEVGDVVKEGQLLVESIRQRNRPNSTPDVSPSKTSRHSLKSNEGAA